MKFSIIYLLVMVVLLGAGCSRDSGNTYPPKPPIPGVQRSPAIDLLTPGR